MTKKQSLNGSSHTYLLSHQRANTIQSLNVDPRLRKPSQKLRATTLHRRRSKTWGYFRNFLLSFDLFFAWQNICLCDRVFVFMRIVNLYSYSISYNRNLYHSSLYILLTKKLPCKMKTRLVII